MNLVDTCGWLEYFNGGPNAEDYAPALEKPETLLVPSICIQEMYRHNLVHRNESDARLATARMRRCQVAPHDADLGILAAKLAAHHKLALADGIVYATAVMHRAKLWTQDQAFKGLPGVQYFEKETKQQG